MRIDEDLKSQLQKLVSNLGMDIPPNRYEKFSGELEEKDDISSCGFLKSSNGKKVLQMSGLHGHGMMSSQKREGI